MSKDDIVIFGSSNLNDRSRFANSEDVVGHELAKPDRLAYFGDFNEFGHEPFGDSLAMLLPLLDATALDRVSDHPSFEKPGMSAFLVSDGEPSGFSLNYHRPQDVLPRDGDIAVVRASIEDLMASYGNDSDAAIEVGSETRDFDQLKRTRSNDLERIEQAVVKANALGIDTSNVASRRDAALAKLSVFSDRFESGGTREVTAAEAEVISQVFGELWGIHSDLDTLVSHWHHYKQHEANHDTWEQRLADRKRNFKVADDAADNRIATSYVTYAANPEETLAASKAAFVELFQAIQRGDLRAAHQADTRARQFSTREHLLDALVRRGKLVVVEDNSTVA